nr:MAG TPA: hypothetical protein [Caudoviricetes sp.]
MKKTTSLNLCLKATLDVLSGVAFLRYNIFSSFIYPTGNVNCNYRIKILCFI